MHPMRHRAKSELRECVTSAKVAAQRLRAI
jgi:hypothetical protein